MNLHLGIFNLSKTFKYSTRFRVSFCSKQKIIKNKCLIFFYKLLEVKIIKEYIMFHYKLSVDTYNS